MKRDIIPTILKDLEEKMVFLSGPRQVGKTTLTYQILGAKTDNHPAYLNWDFPKVRVPLMNGEIPADQRLIVLDEIHKYHDWRNLVKGLYDQYKTSIKFLVTGSARLDYYRRGGDSIQGRYHFHRLHPFSLTEAFSNPSKSDLELLLKFGGFPEPLFKGDDTFYRRWQLERQKLVLMEDMISLEKVREVSKVELLYSVLPEKVGSPLSVNSMREDLSVAHETVEHWLQIFENLYVIFRIPPMNSSKIRSVKKEKKMYFWDWSLCREEGARFENLTASHLLRYCNYREDTFGYKMDLGYIRNSDGKEIDFVVIEDGNPKFAVECKLSEKEISPQIKYFSERLDIPQFYQVHLGDADYENSKFRTRVIPFIKLAQLLQEWSAFLK